MFLSESRQIIRIVKHAVPAVVGILMTQPLSQLKDKQSFQKLGLVDENGMVKLNGCSGFFISPDGHILTNCHVVEDETATYSVVWQGETYGGEVLVRDKENDIAILKISGKGFPFLSLGDSSSLCLGQRVITIGNALGEFTNTVSCGVVSGLSRHIKAGLINSTQEFSGLIQTDAAINPGNSGGPLINIQGKVIGICTAVILNVENMGFATPVNRAKVIWQDVQKHGKVFRPSLGIRYFLVAEQLQKGYNLPFSYGAFIIYEADCGKKGIIPGGSAEKAGLQEGDVILEIDGNKINPNFDLAQALEKSKIGDLVTITYWHQSEKKEASIKIEA